jgi:hypothetical protein
LGAHSIGQPNNDLVGFPIGGGVRPPFDARRHITLVPYFRLPSIWHEGISHAQEHIQRDSHMPRRPANVNQADVQRMIRACQREKVPFRVTLQPNGAAVFEPFVGSNDNADSEKSEDLRDLL